MDDGATPAFRREGDIAHFNQSGIKLEFPNSVSDASFYEWLDRVTAQLGEKVTGASIREFAHDRTDPRRNTGVYYDTEEYSLLNAGAVLRTTSNPHTHAFCAFKLAEDDEGVRRDLRYVFSGADKETIQADPFSESAFDVVRRMLASEGEHPGSRLRELLNVQPEELLRSIEISQHRRTFYVLLDDQDALRCSLDRADVRDLRRDSIDGYQAHFSEIEVPIYPRISADTLEDPRLDELIAHMTESLSTQFEVAITADSKYVRAAKLLALA